MSTARIGDYHIVDDIVNRRIYVNILKQHLLTSDKKLGIKSHFMFQQYKDPKYKARIAKKWILYNTLLTNTTPSCQI